MTIGGAAAYQGRPPSHDAARLHWLRHPHLIAAEVKVGPAASTIVATRVE